MAFDDGTKIERLPEVVYVRLEAIQQLQEEFDDLHRQHVEELKMLEQKYFDKYLPIIAKRSDIVSGRIDPASTKKMKAADIAAKMEAEALAAKQKMASLFNQKLDAGGGDGDDDGDAAAAATTTSHGRKVPDDDGSDDEVKEPEPEKLTFDDIDPSSKQVTGIPGFWLQAMKNHQEVSQLIMPYDEDSLKYLVDIRIEFLPQMVVRLGVGHPVDARVSLMSPVPSFSHRGSESSFTISATHTSSTPKSAKSTT